MSACHYSALLSKVILRAKSPNHKYFNMKINSSKLIPPLFCFIALTACGNANRSKAEEVLSSDSIPQPVKDFVSAVVNNDPEKFANAVNYPLHRPYPLKDINSEKEMKEYYPTLVDDSLRNVVKNAGVSDWESYGWRGWSLLDGNFVWIDDKVYGINYLSQKERKRHAQLVSEEIRSLYPSLQGNWTPVMCLQQMADGTIYRIDMTPAPTDSTEAGPYRMAVFSNGKNLKGRPHKVMRGHKETEGSMQNEIYTFTATDGKVIFSPENFDENTGNDQILIIDRSGTETALPVKSVYWLQLLQRE